MKSLSLSEEKEIESNLTAQVFERTNWPVKLTTMSMAQGNCKWLYNLNMCGPINVTSPNSKLDKCALYTPTSRPKSAFKFGKFRLNCQKFPIGLISIRSCSLGLSI